MRRALLGIAVALALVACGDEGESLSAPEQTVLDWTFKGDCALMTDNFLENQSFIGDSREERCENFKKAYIKPQYSEDDVKFRKVEVNGDRASVTVGSDIANVETTYTLVKAGDGWQIDSADIN